MANSKIPGPIGTYPIRIDSGTLSRTNMPQPGVIGLMDQASYAKVDHAKRALAIDIGQLILDITGIFDPSPISDGTNLLISLARGNWVDAVVSAVSIAPYIGDLSKTAKLPRYIKSVREAIRIAKFDFKWANALRTLFTKLTKVLDECIKLAADVLPNSAKTQLKELKHEVDKFLDPIGGTTNKLADSGKKADLRPSSNSPKSQRNIDRTKPPEKLDKKPEKGYGSNKNNGPTEVDSIKGKLNGEVYGQKRLNALKKYLNRRDAELTIDDPKLPSIMRGAYNGRDNKVYLRSDATEYEVWHELSHYLHRKKIGKKEYMKLERPTRPEQYVYDQLRGNDRRWKRLTPEERDHAMWYVEASGGVAW